MKRTPLKPMSAKTRARLPERQTVRQQVLDRDGYRCQFWRHASYGMVPTSWLCSSTLDVHEIIPRSVWPEGKYHPDNCVTLCRTHHQWVTDNPNAAALIGLHDNSWNRRKDGTPDA